MPITKRPRGLFRDLLWGIHPFWIGLSAGMCLMGCVSNSTLPSATPIPYVANVTRAAAGTVATNVTRVANSVTHVVKQAPIFERVEDHTAYPVTVTGTPGPVNLLPPNDPLLVDARVRGVKWPMVANRGSSMVYPPQQGRVSFYHESNCTATGEKFDPAALTAAHKSLPFGTILRCTRADNKKSVIVMINDRGPYVRGRILDLSPCAARALDMIRDGVVSCHVEVLAYPLIETMGPKGNG